MEVQSIVYILHFQFGEACPTSASAKYKSAKFKILHAGNFKRRRF
jgi:hypothetical protein